MYQKRSPTSNLSITRSHLSRRQRRAIGPLKVPEKRRKATEPSQWRGVRTHIPSALVVFFAWIFPRCRDSKKATGSESRPRKIRRGRRHWRSRQRLDAAHRGKPGTRENRALAFVPSLFLDFPASLLSAPLILVFSLSA